MLNTTAIKNTINKNFLWNIVRIIIIFSFPIFLSFLCFYNLYDDVYIEYNEDNKLKPIESLQETLNNKINKLESLSELIKFDFGIVRYNIYFHNEIYGVANLKNTKEQVFIYVILGVDSENTEYTRINYAEQKLIYSNVKRKNLINYIKSTEFGQNTYTNIPQLLQPLLMEDKLITKGKILIKITPINYYLYIIFLFFLTLWVAVIKIYQELMKLIIEGIHNNLK